MLNGLSREQQLIILGLILVIVAGLGTMLFRHFLAAGSEEIQIEKPGDIKQMVDSAGVVVHVSGAVKKEGVYRLKMGDRIIDALEIAGGSLPHANLSSINLAEKAKDGQKIIVPEKPMACERGSASGHSGSGSGKSIASGRVNINLADEKELCGVSGIGAATAKRIIEHRQANGPFAKTEDIMKVKGIGKGKFEKIKDQIII